MMKRWKALILSFLIFSSLLLLPSCRYYKKYQGDYPDLYTVAVNAIFGATGRLSNGEVTYDPIIELIEIDPYGRVLFYYYERLGYYEKGFRGEYAYYHDTYSCLIMQKVNDGYVYYYEDVCFETYETGKSFALYEGGIDFRERDYSALKELNDWGEEINEENCVKKPINLRHKPLLGELTLENAFNEIANAYVKSVGYKGDDNIYRYYYYNTSDAYGRELYYVWGVGRDVLGEGVSPNSLSQYFDFAIILNPDGSYNLDTCVVEIENEIQCKEELMALKNANNWGMPYYKQ